MQSERPRIGAISIAPFKINKSISLEIDEKYFFEKLGYLEATFNFLLAGS